MFVLAAAIALLSFRDAYAQDPSFQPWHFEVADSSADAGIYTCLVLDSTGQPRICYHDIEHGSLKYAVRRAGAWQAETIDADGVVGRHASAAIDATDHLHVSYFDETRGDLKYATQTATGWRIDRIDTTGTVGQFTALVVDDAGRPHISYHSVTGGALRYAVREGGVWRTETADSIGTQGQWTSIAVGVDGTPHISYYDATFGDLKYAVRRGGAWTVTRVDELGNVGLYTSIRLDRSGRPRIAYTDFGGISMGPRPSPAAHGKHVKYAELTSDGFWRLDIADAVGQGSQYVSMQLDANDEPHITYFDFLTRFLLYTVRHGDELGWTNEFVGEPSGIGDFPTLALDAGGFAHLAYYDGLAGRLRYATTAIALDEPSSGTAWRAGLPVTIRWSGVGQVDVLFSADDGATWTTLRTSVSTDTIHVVAPNVVTSRARIALDRHAPFMRVLSAPFAVRAAQTLAAMPLPLRTGSLSFDVLSAGGDRLDLFDLAGRHVCEIARFDGAARFVTVSWDGRDAQGRRVPGGVYLARLSRAGATHAAIRVVITY